MSDLEHPLAQEMDRESGLEYSPKLKEAKAQFEREHILAALKNQSITKAAQSLGIYRTNVYRLLKKHNIEILLRRYEKAR